MKIKLPHLAIFISTCTSFFSQPCLAQLSQMKSPSVAQSKTCLYGDVIDFTKVSNVLLSDDKYALATLFDCGNEITTCLVTSGYGFTIPAGVLIKGIKVEVERAGVGSDVRENSVTLYKAGIEHATDRANLNNKWGAEAYSAYGGPTDLWGTTWTPADINNSAFGFGVSAVSYECGGPHATCKIDHVRMTVYYSNPTGINEAGTGGAEISLFPNPSADGRITLSSSAPLTDIKLVVEDIYGKQVYTEEKINSQEGAYTLNLQGKLSSGIYFFNFSGKTASQCKKLVIQ